MNQLIQQAATKYLPFDWRIFQALVFQESRFDPLAVSYAGAKGLAQIMPDTFAQWSNSKDIFDPEANLAVGAKYLGWLYGQWTADRPEADRIALALASYNAGLGHLLSSQRLAGGSPAYSDIIARLPEVTGHANAEQTANYHKHIMGHYAEFIANPDHK